MNRNKGTLLSVIGVIISILGVIIWFNGKSDDIEHMRQFSETRLSQGDAICYFGIALIIIGIILFIAGIGFYIVAKSNDNMRGLSGKFATKDESFIINLMDNGNVEWFQKKENGKYGKFKGRFNHSGDNSWIIELKGWSIKFKMDLIDNNLIITSNNFRHTFFPYFK